MRNEVRLFEGLSNKLNAVLERLKGRGALSEADVDEGLREIRVALLEADVALPVVKDFTAAVRAKAVGHDVLQSITPGQQMVKVVHDAIIDTLGQTAVPLNLAQTPPVAFLMLGLQGSGKTSTSGKLAKRLKEVERKKVLLASLDTTRPAAQEQLAILAKQAEVGSLPIIAGEKPEAIARRALEAARIEGYDVVILDTAGRLALDDELMNEAKAVADIAKPAESLLVVDAMMGQDALNVAEQFHSRIGITGIIMTRLDSDARGGAALSMRAVTKQPIKFFTSGEKLDALEVYHPDRIASRILGMGDVLSLVEQAASKIDMADAQKAAARLQKGEFDFEDMAQQLKQMRTMGGVSHIMNMLPGMGKLKEAAASAKIDDRMIKRQEAIIGSMTKQERRNMNLLNASRKRRIASGAGVEVSEINRLIKQAMQMRDVMRQMKKLGGAKGLQSMMGKLQGF